MSKLKRMSLMSVAACALIAPVAFGQADNFYSRDKYEAVMDRVQPEYDPEPIRLGSFLVRSQADLSVTATDNVYASSTATESDVIARAGVRVAADTNWSVHGLGGEVTAHRNEYLDLSDESTTDLTARLGGRLDVTRAFSLGASVFAVDSAEPRSEFANDFGADRPINFTRTGAVVEANYRNDRVRFENSLRLTEENFEDSRTIVGGLNIDQDYRDRSITHGRSRLSYALTPDLAVFAQGTYTDSSYDNLQLVGGSLRSRDSKGYTVAGGVDFELSALVRGDIAVGYLDEKKDDAFFADVSGLSLDGRLQWFPTRLTTVSLTGARRVVDTGAFESPSAVETVLGARVDHELRRNIILSAYGTTFDYAYQETDREDQTLELGAVATYKMNKRVHWDAFVRNRDRDVSGLSVLGDPSYGITSVGVGLRLFL